MFCKNCGTKLLAENVFCTNCGAKIESVADQPQDIKNSKSTPGSEHPNSINAKTPETAAISEEQPKTPRSTGKSENTIIATGIAGEMVFSKTNLTGLGPEDLSPLKVIIGGFKGIISNINGIFSNKKKLIPILILSVIWIVLILLPLLGINPLPVRFASWLTFAQGGASRNVLRVIGGIVGKGVFGVFFVSIFNGGFKSIIIAIPKTIRALKLKSSRSAGIILFGAGVALICYNFMTGYAAFIKSMVGVAALALILRALGSGGGFLLRLLTSLTLKTTTIHKVNITDAVEGVMVGMSLGFTLGILISLLPWGYTPYCIGAASLVSGTILVVLSKTEKEAK